MYRKIRRIAYLFGALTLFDILFIIFMFVWGENTIGIIAANMLLFLIPVYLGSGIAQREVEGVIERNKMRKDVSLEDDLQGSETRSMVFGIDCSFGCVGGGIQNI